jgi:hypothetical protein
MVKRWWGRIVAGCQQRDPDARYESRTDGTFAAGFT